MLEAGPKVYQNGTRLGLQDKFFSGEYDNLDALSYGQDVISAPIYFSVDRVAVGVPGTDVNAQAAPGVEEASGDIFKALPPFGGNQLFMDEQALGLVPGFFADDVDAFDLDKTASPWTYFSFDFLSASNGYGTLGLANDIYASRGDGMKQLYFDLERIGFKSFDDLDALVLADANNDGKVDRGVDRALFSLSSFSPSTFTGSGLDYVAGKQFHLSPADILWTDFISWKLWRSAEEIGLRSDDNVDALDTVPEPATLYLLCIGLIGAVANQRWRRRVSA